MFGQKLLRKLQEWKDEVMRHKEVILLSLFLLIVAIIIDYNAGKYVRNVSASVVPDFILDNIPPINLSFLFVEGWLIISFIFFIYPLFFRVNKIHEVLSQFSLLIIIRSFFITLTHLKTPLDAIPISFPGILKFLQFENDLFFSGHVAVPFLGFLLFKGEKIRWFFLASSIVMAVTVLLMHQHYTIDVMSAFFIAYGTYKLGKVLFRVLEKKR